MLYARVVIKVMAYLTGKYEDDLEIFRLTVELFKRDSRNQIYISQREAAYKKWRELLRPPGLENLTREDFVQFLDIKENKSWTGLQRHPEVASDIEGLKEVITFLLDESIDIEERIRKTISLSRDGGVYHIDGMGRNLVTGILLVCDTQERYGVWNNRSEKILKLFRFIPQRLDSNPGKAYTNINNALLKIKNDYDLSLNEVDTLVYWIDNFFGKAIIFPVDLSKNPGVIEKYQEVIREKKAALWGADFPKGLTLDEWGYPRKLPIPTNGYLYVTGDDVRYRAIVEGVESYSQKKLPSDLELRPHEYSEVPHRVFLRLTKLEPLPNKIKLDNFKKVSDNEPVKSVQSFAYIYDPYVINPDLFSSKIMFRLTDEDFQACIRSQSENHIKPVREKFENQLKSELIDALLEGFEDFKTDSSPYVSRTWSRGGYYTDHVWIGFAHKKYENPRNGFQLQFGINQNAVFTFGVSVESGYKSLLIRKESAQKLRENKKHFHELITKYEDDYRFVAVIDGQDIEEELPIVSEDDVDKWIELLETRCYFQIRRELSPQKAVEMGTSIVEHIAETFTELLPIYNFLANVEGIEISHNFIFRTGGGEYEDRPSTIYHFRERIPGYKQVLDAENKGEFVYYEFKKGGFWGRGKIGNIGTEQREGMTHYFVQVKNYEEIGPISFDSVKEQLSFDSIGQAGMRKISKDDFNVIINAQPRASPRYTIDDFMNETGFGRDEIECWVRSLLRKNHIIFQGPPGTGKTYVAERLARHFVSETSGFWEVVQFHSAYNYEDFIQGLQPKPVGSVLSFELVPGRFLQFCRRVRLESHGDPCVLIIDEINRANLARVFGELMYLLEYRDKAIPLAAGGEPFQIPRNVYLIGTMNTADRSIALVDHALRRRFSFIRLRPKYDILERELRAHNFPADELISILKEINQAIDDPNYEVGISFFMKDKERLKEFLPMIWESEIEPYLEEYFYDQPGKVRSFRWENLVKEKMNVWVD